MRRAILADVRTLAIDLGTCRVGLALSDEGGCLATPYDVLQVSSPEKAIEPIAQIVRREGVQRIVVGLPLNMDGTLGPKARETIAWARALEKRGTVPLLLVDERLSSFEAEQQLIARKRGGEKITRKAKKQQLDALAAARFLQDHLDGKLPTIDVKLAGER
jgi:putative Holliday junction resolvase